MSACICCGLVLTKGVTAPLKDGLCGVCQEELLNQDWLPTLEGTLLFLRELFSWSRGYNGYSRGRTRGWMPKRELYRKLSAMVA